MDLSISILILAGIFFLIAIFTENRILGARYICNLYFLIYMVVAPINEKINNIIYYGGSGVSDYSYFIVAIFVLLFSFLSLLSSVYFKSKNYQGTIEAKKTGNIFFLPWLFGLIYLFLVDWNFGYLIIREPIIDKSSQLTFLNYLFADRFCRLVIAVSVFLVVLVSDNFTKKILSLIALLIFCFPTAMPRNITIIVYLPFIILFMEKKFVKISFNIPKKILLNLFIIFLGPFTLMLLNYFRNIKTLDNFTFKISNNLGNFLKKGHLDSFQSVQNSIDYVDITWGQQLLGALFFFIPRKIWESKPIGSGGLIANSSGFDWFNVNASYLAEAYINFGYIGMILFILILIYLITKLDRVHFQKIHQLILYYFFPGIILKLLIGDMINAFSMLLPFMMIFLFLKFIIKN